MKKILFCCLCMLMLSTSINAWDLVPLTVRIDDNMPIGHGHSKTPINPPTLYIEDYTLSFEIGHPDYVLNIKDEDGEVVYTTIVYSAQTEVVLPSTLSGDYEIELIMGNWLFIGYINL